MGMRAKLNDDYEIYRQRIQTLDVKADLQHPVFGAGKLPADIVFIGEAPGAQEVEQGRPFVGKAGKQLDELLEEAGIARDHLFVTNAVKYRPLKHNGRANRTPTTKEIAFSRGLLVKELELIRPKLVVTLGNSPLLAVTCDSKMKIGQVHGEFLDRGDYVLFPTYHPASLIYNRSLLEVYRADLQKLSSWAQANIDRMEPESIKNNE